MLVLQVLVMLVLGWVLVLFKAEIWEAKIETVPLFFFGGGSLFFFFRVTSVQPPSGFDSADFWTGPSTLVLASLGGFYWLLLVVWSFFAGVGGRLLRCGRAA